MDLWLLSCAKHTWSPARILLSWLLYIHLQPAVGHSLSWADFQEPCFSTPCRTSHVPTPNLAVFPMKAHCDNYAYQGTMLQAKLWLASLRALASPGMQDWAKKAAGQQYPIRWVWDSDSYYRGSGYINWDMKLDLFSSLSLPWDWSQTPWVRT